MMKKKAAQKSSSNETDSFVMPNFRVVYGKPKK